MRSPPASGIVQDVRIRSPRRGNRWRSGRFPAALVACLILASQGGAAGPLAELPSPSGPHVEKLRALGADSWIELGAPKADPEWGPARGRSYSPKMAAAADLGGAFLCGTGVHGYVKPDGHFMDDLWFYDANAHRWICLYPGASKETRLKLDEHGFEVTLEGEHNPISYFSHGYNNLTYDPDQKRLMLIYTHSPWWRKALPQRAEWLGIPAEELDPYKTGRLKTNVKHPLFWNVADNRWERTFAEGPGPSGGRFESILEYLPGRKRALWIDESGKPWLFDIAAGRWEDIGAGQTERLNVYSSIGCHDTRRDRVYVLSRNRFIAFDLKTNRWSELAAGPQGMGYVTAGQINYDPAGDVVVGISFSDREGRAGRGASIYDPETNRWSERPAPMPAARGNAANSYYDANLDVHFVYVASDSGDNGVMLAYRYGKRRAE